MQKHTLHYHFLPFGEHLVGSPVGSGVAAGRVMLVQQAAPDGHSGVRVGIPVDVIDQHVALLPTVVA